MKAKDLCKLLEDYPDFEITTALSELDGSDYGLTVRKFELLGVGDIGHSDKVIQLDFKEV